MSYSLKKHASGSWSLTKNFSHLGVIAMNLYHHIIYEIWKIIIKYYKNSFSAENYTV